MSKCVRCKLEVLDNSVMCPLCHGVLSEQGEDTAVSMYPDVSEKSRKLVFVLKLVIFLSVLAEIACIAVNVFTYNGVRWSIASGLALLYACFTLVYSARKNKSHQRKMIMQLVFGLAFVFIVDLSLGFEGWSLEYAIPIATMAMDIGIGVLMLVNKKNWQSYVMPQLWLILISGICLGLEGWKMNKLPLLGMIAMGVAVLAIAVTLVFGEKKAESELHRRFHI